MLVISVWHEVWSKWFEKHDDTVLTLLLFPHCWNVKANVIYAIDIESLHVTWTSPARFDPVFTNIDLLSRGWDSRTTYHWWHPCFGFRHRALKNRVQGTQARVGAGQSASTPRSPTSSLLDLFILAPPPKKKWGDGMGLQTSFPRILRPSPEQVLGNIVWQHGCTRSPMQTIGVDVGPSSDLKKITTDYSTSEDLQSFKLGTSYRKNGIK